MLFPLPRSLQRSNNTGAAVAEDGDSGGSAVAEGAQGARASCCPIPEAVGNQKPWGTVLWSSIGRGFLLWLCASPGDQEELQAARTESKTMRKST